MTIRGSRAMMDQIKFDYWALKLGYDSALDALVRLGLSEGAADDFIHKKDDIRKRGRKAGGFDQVEDHR